MGQRTFKPRHANAPGRTFNGRLEIDRLYDKDWERYRARFLKLNPKCYSCGEIATVCDHLVNHLGSVELFKKLDNHLPLCARCHNTITARFDRRFKVGNSITPKLTWINNNRLMNDVTFKVKVLASYD